jgi:hypothetical protein
MAVLMLQANLHFLQEPRQLRIVFSTIVTAVFKRRISPGLSLPTCVAFSLTSLEERDRVGIGVVQGNGYYLRIYQKPRQQFLHGLLGRSTISLLVQRCSGYTNRTLFVVPSSSLQLGSFLITTHRRWMQVEHVVEDFVDPSSHYCGLSKRLYEKALQGQGFSRPLESTFHFNFYIKMSSLTERMDVRVNGQKLKTVS